MAIPDIEIRAATPADVQDIVALNDALFQEDAGQRDPLVNLAWAREHGYDFFLKRVTDEGNVCFVAISASECVGYLAGYTYGPGSLRPIQAAELESMFVRATWRNQGVGTKLAQTFLAWARAQGARRIRVTAYSANQAAIAFYQSTGFTPHQLTLECDVL